MYPRVEYIMVVEYSETNFKNEMDEIFFVRNLIGIYQIMIGLFLVYFKPIKPNTHSYDNATPSHTRVFKNNNYPII